jgi:hypothetical protein
MKLVTRDATPTFSNTHAYGKVGIRLLTGMLFLFGIRLHAQPYLDIVSVRYQYSPDAGMTRRGYQPSHFTYGNLTYQAPGVFKDSSILIIGGLLEKWNIKSSGLSHIKPHFTGLALPVTYVKPLNQKWTATASLIPRFDTYSDVVVMFGDRMQWGGALLMTYKKSSQLKYKFGLYYNREYFGNFFVPLLGIDWRVNERLKLFGVLPGNLVLERKVSRKFYYGASFRALTNSYKSSSSNWLDFDDHRFFRIDDNQLQAFADFYLAKNVVLTTEAGHSVFRRLRTGISKGISKYEASEKVNDNVLLRAGLAYRMRFD